MIGDEWMDRGDLTYPVFVHLLQTTTHYILLYVHYWCYKISVGILKGYIL